MHTTKTKNIRKQKPTTINYKQSKQEEWDRLLDKIGKSGLDSLSKEEKELQTDY